MRKWWCCVDSAWIGMTGTGRAEMGWRRSGQWGRVHGWMHPLVPPGDGGAVGMLLAVALPAAVGRPVSVLRRRPRPPPAAGGAAPLVSALVHQASELAAPCTGRGTEGLLSDNHGSVRQLCPFIL